MVLLRDSRILRDGRMRNGIAGGAKLI